MSVDGNPFSGMYLSCFLVAWKPPAPKGGGAHRNSASTAPTNNLRVAVRYYNQRCNEALITPQSLPVSSSVQPGASRKA